MKNYEHKIECLGGELGPEGGSSPRGPITMALDRAGREGWILVSIVPSGAGGLFAFFRREKI